MRWKLIRRRLSISAPRMIVRGALPWPLRWAAYALVLGFSAALALWAFEFGKEIAGLDRGTQEELQRLRAELADMRGQRDKAQAVADSVDSMLKAEHAAQGKLAQQLKQAEAENLTLKGDLGFFERLMPTGGAADSGIAVRGLQAEVREPGHLKYQLLVMQNGRKAGEFSGRYELQLAGTLDGQPWTFAPAQASGALRVRQYTRVEGMIDHPPAAMVKTVQVKVIDDSGAVRVTQSVKL